MDVVNGKIVDTATRVGPEETTRRTRTGGDSRVMADQRHPWSGRKPSRGLGFAGDARTGSGPRAPQPSTGNFSQAAPSWATTTSSLQPQGLAVAAAFAPATPRWNHSPPEPARLLESFRPGWRRTDLDRGRLSEPAREVLTPLALGLKPSHACSVDASGSSREQLPGSFARAAAADWAPTWAPSSSLSLEPASPAFGALTECRSPQPEHRQGWKWNTPGARTLASSPTGGVDPQRPRYHFDASPCSEGKLDEVMNLFESQLTRTVSGRISRLVSASSITSGEIPEGSAPVDTDAGEEGVSSGEKKTADLVTAIATATATTSTLKRKRSGLSDGDAQGEERWTEPLTLLVRKELTQSDVGELARIILPKKDAESRSFPQVVNKEGVLLELEDHSASRRWYFRYKYWTNNKSRMYVLENTGDFIKYHCLKEHDLFTIYEDGCKKLVVCGQRKFSVLERSKSFTLETPPTRTEEDNAYSRDQSQ